MVNYVCVKTVPDSTKFHLIKGPNQIFPRGACPRTHLLSHMLCTQIRICLPPPIIHTISFCPPLGKKLKETLVVITNGKNQNLNGYLQLKHQKLGGGCLHKGGALIISMQPPTLVPTMIYQINLSKHAGTKSCLLFSSTVGPVLIM